MKKIYLDYAATSPVDPRVIKAMSQYWHHVFGNPSSLHAWGQAAEKKIGQCRQQVAKFLTCQPSEVIFTSCATEANNFVLKGTVEAWQKQNKTRTAHMIVSPIEHHCVLDSVKHLEKQGVKVSWLKVDKFGLVDSKQVGRLINKNTVLVSVMYANNEIGTIEPIAEIAQIIRNKEDLVGKKVFFHTDAVQAIQYLNCRVNKLGVDFLTASAHKFYGPKGIGFLYLRKGSQIVRQQDGGSQEFGFRAGTENVAGIVGLTQALQIVEKNKQAEKQRLTKLRDYLIKNVLKKIDQAQLTGHPQKRLPHIASFVFAEAEGEAMLLHLDALGIATSSGSACTSDSLKPSHVLLSIGLEPELAHGSLRLSLGKDTTQKDIDYLLKVLPKIIRNLRKLAPKL